jgi:hypothetical protein
MSDTTKLPETVPPGRKVDPELDELATRISTDYAAIIKADREVMAANHSVVERAISLGNKLHMATDKAGRGNWLPWLKEKCPEIPERTAQRYMNLADKADVLAKKMKSATMADLTLKMALDLVDDKTPSGDKKGGNASDTSREGNDQQVAIDPSRHKADRRQRSEESGLATSLGAAAGRHSGDRVAAPFLLAEGAPPSNTQYLYRLLKYSCQLVY